MQLKEFTSNLDNRGSAIFISNFYELKISVAGDWMQE